MALPPTTRWNEQAHLFAGDAQPQDGFGNAVAISGDTMVVAAYADDTAGGDAAGSAYVYARSDEAWSQQGRLYASDGEEDDWFGTSVGVSGDRIVVGAKTDDTAAGANAGSAYAFVRSGKTWTSDGHIFAGDPGAGDQFGWSAGISGDTIVIGVPDDDTAAGTGAGSAYVFKRGGLLWGEQGHLFPSDPGAGDAFGRAVAIDGDTVVIGAQYWDGYSANGCGSAYVFTRSGDTWSQQDQLGADDFETGDEFGCSVAISGDLVVVGSCQDDTVAGSDPGSAYVFARSGGTWTQQAHLYADDARPYDHFGAAVAISGDTIVVGAYGDHTGAGDAAGSAYVFARVGGNWSQQDHIFASDPSSNDEFGDVVAISGDTVVVGVAEDATAAGSFAGSAYVYVRSFLDTFIGESPALMPGRR